MRDAHNKNVYHGNLKPENIMIDSEATLIITDWQNERSIHKEGVQYHKAPECY